MKKYLVALAVRETNNQSNFSYCNYDIIEANDPVEACEKYNRKYKCGYFSGACIGEYNEETRTVTISISHFGIFR